MPIPYHLLRDPYRSRSRVPELIMEQGRINAEGIRRSGDIWAQTIAQAAGGIGEAIRQGPERKMLEEERAARSEERRAATEEHEARTSALRTQEREKAALRGALESGKARDEILAQTPGDLRATVQKHWDEADERANKLDAAKMEYIGGLAGSIKDSPPELRNSFMAGAITHMRARGYDSEADQAEQLIQQHPDKLEAILDHYIKLSPTQRKLAGEEEERALKLKTFEGAQADRTTDNARQQAALAETMRHNRAIEAKGEGKEPIKTDVFNAETGEMETRFITREDAAAMARGEKPAISKGPGTAERNRMAAARASIESGETLLSELKDPKFADKIGAVMGRYNSLAAAAGAGDPDAQYIVGAIKSFSALQPQIHGFRAVQMAQDIEKLLSTKQDPKALAAALSGVLTASYTVAKKTAPGAPEKKNPFR